MILKTAKGVFLGYKKCFNDIVVNKLKIVDPTYLSKLFYLKLRSFSLSQKELTHFKFETYH